MWIMQNKIKVPAEHEMKETDNQGNGNIPDKANRRIGMLNNPDELDRCYPPRYHA